MRVTDAGTVELTYLGEDCCILEPWSSLPSPEDQKFSSASVFTHTSVDGPIYIAAANRRCLAIWEISNLRRETLKGISHSSMTSISFKETSSALRDFWDAVDMSLSKRCDNDLAENQEDVDPAAHHAPNTFRILMGPDFVAMSCFGVVARFNLR
jgi:hypothetical protein